MHTNLEISIGESNAVEGIIDILAPGWIDTADFDVAQIQPIGFLRCGDGEVLASRRQTFVCFPRKLLNLDIVLQQNHITFSPRIASIPDDAQEMAERILGVGGPGIVRNLDSLAVNTLGLSQIESTL